MHIVARALRICKGDPKSLSRPFTFLVFPDNPNVFDGCWDMVPWIAGSSTSQFVWIIVRGSLLISAWRGIYWFQRAMMRCHRYVDAQWIRYVPERNTFRPSVQEDWIGNDGCEVKVMQKFPKMVASDDRVVESSVVCRIFNPFYEFISQSFVLQRTRHFECDWEKNIRKNIICKTSEGATRSRTKSRGANPASRPSAKTHIQTENSTLSNRVFFCIIILLRTLVFLPFLHTILLWYFFVLLDFPNVLGFWICVFALDDDFASSLGSSIFEKCWVTLLVALWFSNVLGFWIRLFVCSGWCFSWLSWFFDFPWLFDFENSSN